MSDIIVIQPDENNVVVSEITNSITTASDGPQGPAGPTGATGATGATGPAGSSGVVAVTAPITNSGTSSSANIGISAGTTSAAGALQLTDSVASTSTTTAATPNAVKTAYDFAGSRTSTLVPPSGYYVQTPFQSYQSITATLSRTNYVPIYLPASVTFDRIGIATSSVFSGTASVRMGIFANDATTAKPSTLILDAGTVSCTVASTLYQITISQTLSAGLYWIAMNTQTAATTNSFLGLQSSQGVFNNLLPYKTLPTASFTTGWREESITGAFSNAGTLLTLGASPFTYLRTA